MEYEIEEDALLFDISTNPSLVHQHRRPDDAARRIKPREDPAPKRRLQKAEVIPEEEPA